MAATKKLAVVTSTRADYGLLRGVLAKLFCLPDVTTLLVATGTHLSSAYGNTVQEIENDGFPIAARIPILQADTAATMACTFTAFSAWLRETKPHAILLLGDRFEIFSVASAAAVEKVPILHISGGDVTEGAEDDFYRHCITKMASVHFPSNADSAARLLRMGEQPDTVHNVGGLGDENIRSLTLMSKAELEKRIGFALQAPYALVTFHPQTAGNADAAAQFNTLLAALDKIPLRYIFTKANADAGGAAINALIDAYCQKNAASCIAFTSMGVLRYLAAMRSAAVVIGNSSSGVVETPTFGVPTVNIGTRQAGRIVCDNVLCCPVEEQEIENAVRTALTPTFIQRAKATQSPYNGGNTSGKIVQLVHDYLYSARRGAPKLFYDAQEG